jgi:hypothetical protein
VSDPELAALRTQLADLEAALEVALAGRESDARQWRARLNDAERRMLLAQQEALSERAGRAVAETALRLAEEELDELTLDPVSRELAAERRVRALELELELVIRRAAEFEYGVRVVLSDAFSVLGRLAERVRAALGGDNSTPSGEKLNLRLDEALARLRAETPPLDDSAE